MKLWRVRRELYRWARLLGDVEAVSKGPDAVMRRMARKLLWRAVGKVLTKGTRK